MLNIRHVTFPFNKPVRAVSRKGSDSIGKLIVIPVLVLLTIDTGYRLLWGISPQTRDRCILFSNLPRWASLLYENIFELGLIIVASVFIAVVLEKYLSKYSGLIPTHPMTAFLYGAMIPVCSCGILPLVSRFKDRMSLRTLIALLVTGPLLSPQIIIMSFTILGPVYAVARLISTFILAMAVGLAIDLHGAKQGPAVGPSSCQSSCKKPRGNIFVETWETVKKILPFALLAGVLGIIIEIFKPLELIKAHGVLNSVAGLLVAVLVGIPIYLCNGADIVFLQPLVSCGNLPLGTAIAFSLISSSVCAASLVMMSCFLGKKTTWLFLIHIITGTLIIGIVLNNIHY